MRTNHNRNTLALIKSIQPSLSKVERKVAEYVLLHADEIIYSSVTDLAEKAGVGETSVIRFCRKLEFRGFQDFKLSIAQDLVHPTEKVHGEVTDRDSIEVVMQKVTSQNTLALTSTTSLLTESELIKATDALLNAKRIFFFGVGSSGITANDAKYRFMRLGFQTDSASDAHIISMNAALVTSQDVVVGISSSGSTKDLVEGIALSHENGAYVIALTNHSKSPITLYAQCVLLASSKETPFQGGAFASKIAQMHVLDILSTLVAMKSKDSTYASIKKTAQSVVNKLY